MSGRALFYGFCSSSNNLQKWLKNYKMKYKVICKYA